MPKIVMTDEELVLLDGKVEGELKEEVDAAKARLASVEAHPALEPNLAKFVADVVRIAQKEQKLVYQFKGLRYCPVCGKTGGYAKYKRSGRYHRKGQPNYSKPLTFGGVELIERYVVVAGHASFGCCRECMDKVLWDLKESLQNVEAELPIELEMHGEPRYKRYRNSECEACGWKGHKGQLLLVPALMSGKYPGKCPECGHVDKPLSVVASKIKDREGYTLVKCKTNTTK